MPTRTSCSLLDDGRHIFFRDTRKFGRVRLLTPAGLAALDAAHGLEPLSPRFTALGARGPVAGRRVKLKSFLLDQSLVAGIGNIYADEALHRAGFHPCAPRRGWTREEVGPAPAPRPCGGAEAAIARKARYWEGAVRAHEPGLRRTSAVYDRAGEPCRTCGGRSAA